MRVFPFIGAALLSFLPFAVPSHAQSIELFGGYSFVRAPVTFVQTTPLCPVFDCPAASNKQTLNLNGFEVGGALKVLGPLAIAADFSDTSGSFQGADVHLKTYLFGPQLRFPGPVSPFAHFLLGGAHESIGTGTTPVFTSGPTQNAFATAVGVGIDLKVLPLLSIRPIQFDYLLTRFNSSTQNQPRVSAGIVLRF
jgi:hypothetical protein